LSTFVVLSTERDGAGTLGAMIIAISILAVIIGFGLIYFYSNRQ
jgi:hypothetical protein